MKLWRITTRQWALDTVCDGARLYGGRWNPIGYPAMYAGSTIELCALEKLVHMAGSSAPALVLVAIEVPDDPQLTIRPALATLPGNWFDLPFSATAQEFGRAWLESKAQLLMLVPSAIIPEASNAVINPAHPAYREIKLSVVREFSFDARLFHPH